jgi:4-azaleucine resistance transporter AzlC
MAADGRRWHADGVAVLPETTPRARFRSGLRAGVPFAAAGFLLSLSFGVLGVEAGMSVLGATLMSLVVFAGSAQFASISILAAGGGMGAAVAAAAMMNSRFLPMGLALGPSLPGGPVRRALSGQAMVDSSWAMAARGDGTFDRHFLWGHTAVQYVTWSLGTLTGALVGDVIDPRAWGLDAIFPTFFLAILLGEVQTREALGVALAAGGLALALVPVVPAGVPVLLAGLVALRGVRRT